jgi:hypothetical protein
MKKIILPCLALMLAVGFSAFKAPHAAKFTNTTYYYNFTGTQVEAQWAISSNYSLKTNPTVDPDCTGTDECVVAISYPTGTEPTTLTALTLTVNGSGFPNGLSNPPTNVSFVKNEKLP